MFFHFGAVVIRQVADVESPPRRRRLEVARMVAHCGGRLGEEVVEIVVEASRVGKVGGVPAEVTVQKIVEDLEGKKEAFYLKTGELPKDYRGVHIIRVAPSRIL